MDNSCEDYIYHNKIPFDPRHGQNHSIQHIVYLVEYDTDGPNPDYAWVNNCYTRFVYRYCFRLMLNFPNILMSLADGPHVLVGHNLEARPFQKYFNQYFTSRFFVISSSFWMMMTIFPIELIRVIIPHLFDLMFEADSMMLLQIATNTSYMQVTRFFPLVRTTRPAVLMEGDDTAWPITCEYYHKAHLEVKEKERKNIKIQKSLDPDCSNELRLARLSSIDPVAAEMVRRLISNLSR